MDDSKSEDYWHIDRSIFNDLTKLFTKFKRRSRMDKIRKIFDIKNWVG